VPVPDAANVTIVVPVRNEADTLRGFISDLEAQTVKPAAVVVCDGGSSDGSVAMLDAWAQRDATVTVITVPHGLPGRTRNAGIEVARTPWVALADAGNRVAHDWLEQLVTRRNQPDHPDVIFGTYEPELDTFAQRCGAMAWVATTQAHDGGFVRGPSTASMLLTKTAWASAGMFPEDLRAAEDLLFFDRLAAGRARTAWAPLAVVTWSGPATFRRMFGRFRTFSRHALRAGLAGRWHAGVIRQYVALAVVLLLGVVHHPLWLLAVPAGLVARVAKSMHARRKPFGPGLAPRPSLVAGVVWALLTADAAMFAGTLDHLRAR
jgi:glycosyltransferase involved in cell wall biosynthesis